MSFELSSGSWKGGQGRSNESLAPFVPESAERRPPISISSGSACLELPGGVFPEALPGIRHGSVGRTNRPKHTFTAIDLVSVRASFLATDP